MDLNKVMLIGRLTRDPEVRATPSGQNVANFAVATNHTWKDASGQKQEKPEYTDIVAWGKLAEIVQQYVTKGRRIYVEGRLQTRDWTANDGVRKFKTEVIAENMIMLDGPRGSSVPGPAGSDAGYGNGGDNMDAPRYSPIAPTVAQASAGANDDEIKIEDIPF